MHWYSFNNAVRLVNKAKTRLFRSTLNFKNFENHGFRLTASLADCQPAIRPGCARCRALKITQNNRLLTKLLFRKLFSYCDMVILFALLSSLSIGMRKQLTSPQHSIHGANREVMRLLFYCVLASVPALSCRV